ncbi:MAG: class A beta-lactamase-related serine hydrolase [Paramuribaculum sp.]|nr:class A beta-lactamase-related serine hydrolase [Paramuribaculum sp.]
MKINVLACVSLFAAILAGCVSNKYSADRLRDELKDYVESKDCRIGVAVIYNGDTIAINGNDSFPMLSVYKFPQAIAAGKIFCELGITPDDTIAISASLMLPDTWSPLRDRYGINDIKLPIGEVLSYSLMMSDNNACDILFEMTGGVDIANDLIKSLGYKDINLRNTEAEMNADPNLCYDNSATPIALAALMSDFYSTMCSENDWMRSIKANLELCETGKGRIPAAAFDEETLIGHKTGTGPKGENGKIIAVNDVGYVEFASGDNYTIAVMVCQSSVSLEDTERMVGEISEIVRRNIEQTK